MGRNHSGFASDSPAYDAFAVTASDATVFEATRALYVGGAGDVAVKMAGGTELTFTAVTAGAILPLQVTMVKATGTTATGIVGIY